MKTRAHLTIIKAKNSGSLCWMLVALFWALPNLGEPSKSRAEEVPAWRTQRHSGDFRLTIGPLDKGEPGFLGKGGYAIKGARLTKTKYQAVDKEGGEAIVDVVTHPCSYSYVANDVMATLQVVLEEEKRKTPTGAFQLTQYPKPDGSGNAIIYDARISDSDGIRGVVGWYETNGDGCMTSVLIRYERLDGIPVKLVDEFLQKYRSEVVNDESVVREWKKKDIRKWIEIIRSAQPEDPSLSAARAYLLRYDKEAFGLDDLVLNRNDAQAFATSKPKVIGKLEDWLRSNTSE